VSRKTPWAIAAGAAALAAVLVSAWFVAGQDQPEPVQTPIFDASETPLQTAMAEAAARAWVTFDLTETTEERVDRLLRTFQSTDGLQGYARSAHQKWWSQEDTDIQVRVTDVDAVTPIGKSGGAWIFSVFLDYETTVTQFGKSQVSDGSGEFWVYVPKTGDLRAALIQER
jgi:hypothetical protein